MQDDARNCAALQMLDHVFTMFIDITWHVPTYPAQCEHQGHVTCIHSPHTMADLQSGHRCKRWVMLALALLDFLLLGSLPCSQLSLVFSWAPGQATNGEKNTMIQSNVSEGFINESIQSQIVSERSEAAAYELPPYRNILQPRSTLHYEPLS